VRRVAELWSFGVNMPLPSHTLETAAAHDLGMQDAKSWADWATQALVEGFDSPNLRILAGLTPPYDELEVARLSRSALAALGMPPLTIIRLLRPQYQLVTWILGIALGC
jgi:hypothetical protein